MNTNQIAHIAALAGEPARTGMLLALMDGRSLTARELADAAHITPATASRHLALMVQAGLLAVHIQGRHRYHRLASADVARWVEGLMQLAAHQAPAARSPVVGPRDAALRRARTCYDHLAGRLAVAMAGHLLAEGAVVFEGQEGSHVTDRAVVVLGLIGLDAAGGAPAGASRRPLCRPCLDWSERRLHVAGRLGAMLCAHCMGAGWLVRSQGSRSLSITPPGAAALRNWLGHARWSEVVGD